MAETWQDTDLTTFVARLRTTAQLAEAEADNEGATFEFAHELIREVAEYVERLPDNLPAETYREVALAYIAGGNADYGAAPWRQEDCTEAIAAVENALD